jgi:hypothetical protein
MQADQFEIVQAAGLDPELFDVIGYATAFEADELLPAILVGTYRGCNAAIRAEVRVQGGLGKPVRWDAIAFVSRHPGMALDCLTFEERERLRAETLTPTGHDAPVGQAAVIGKTEFAPRILPREPTEHVPHAQPEPDETADGILAAPSPCGGAECFVMQGPEGTQEVHDPGSCPLS